MSFEPSLSQNPLHDRRIDTTPKKALSSEFKTVAAWLMQNFMDEDVTIFVQVANTRDLREITTMGVSKDMESLYYNTEEGRENIVFKSESVVLESSSPSSVMMRIIINGVDGGPVTSLVYTFRLMTPVTPV
jgi:hypothetical protein